MTDRERHDAEYSGQRQRGGGGAEEERVLSIQIIKPLSFSSLIFFFFFQTLQIRSRNEIENRVISNTIQSCNDMML